MAWKEQRTRRSAYAEAEVTVDLAEFDAKQLLQGLINADWLTETEAELIADRAAKKEPARVVPFGVPQHDAFDENELLEAFDYARRGNRQEAYYRLEKALGKPWYGLLESPYLGSAPGDR